MRKLFLLSVSVLMLSGCAWLNPSIMLKTKKDYQYAKLPDTAQAKDYRISPNDIIEFNMYSNDGFKLVDLTSLNNANMGYRFESNLQYVVESDCTVKLPTLGKTNLVGMTIKEAEAYLEQQYAAFYVRPFVLMSVINKRVIIFPGSEGTAKVIPLVNNNTTLIEALALAGGISENGKARMIKLIRENNGQHDVYLMDLSKIEGIKMATMVLQANDIVYVEPRRRYTTKFLAEVAPLISLLTSAFVLYSYSRIISPK